MALYKMISPNDLKRHDNRTLMKMYQCSQAVVTRARVYHNVEAPKKSFSITHEEYLSMTYSEIMEKYDVSYYLLNKYRLEQGWRKL